MPAPAVSHLICTTALVMLIFTMPFFYSMIVNNIQADMVRRELKEIADYVSNTLANLYFLVNSTDRRVVSMEKELLFLPAMVENSIFLLKIDGTGGDASRILTYLKGRSFVSAEAWLSPGLKVGAENTVESGSGTVVVGCSRDATGIYVSIKYG